MLQSRPAAMPDSLWAATAEPAPETVPLDGDRRVDVAVIGGGFSGLSTALHLAEAGIEVQVLEANEIGWGASGRSGGQVIPGIKFDPDQMVAMFGDEAGRRAAGLFGSTADAVFDIIGRYGISCEATRNGWAQPAHSLPALKTALDRCRQWQALGADVESLSREEMADLLGTDSYYGGWIDRRGGSVQPLSYTRGLAKAALSRGVGIASATKVASISRQADGWELNTEGGTKVRAKKVAVCANAYSKDLWPKLEQSVIAANSFQIATRPLPTELGRTILKGGVAASDTRRLLAYFRRDKAGRFILGGRGRFRDPTSESDFGHLQRMIARIYPALESEPIEFRWAGRVAITQDFLPHLHEPEPGLILYLGCQGRGVGLQTKMGSWVADYLRTGDRSCLPIPVTPIRQIPLHALRRLYVSAMLAYYRVVDLIA